MKKGGVDALVDNVTRLMKARGDNQTSVAARGGLSQRAVGYVVTYGKTHHTSPTLRTVEGLAKAFELPAWLLLLPNVPIELLTSPRLASLIENYCATGDEGRETIDRIGDAVARFGSSPVLYSKSG